MYHSITFGDKNTWDDWHLVPESRPLFVPPEPKIHEIDIPGMDGVLDMSESLTGYPVYNNRKGEFEFYVMNGYQEWHELYSEISNYLRNKKMRAYLEDDPDWYYEGRFRVNEWRSEKDYSKIVISYDVWPYKWNKLTSLDHPDYQTKYGSIYAGSTLSIGDEIKAPVEPMVIVYDADTNPITCVHTRTINGSTVSTTYSRLYSGIYRTMQPSLVLYGDMNSSLTLTQDSSSPPGHISLSFKIGSL